MHPLVHSSFQQLQQGLPLLASSVRRHLSDESLARELETLTESLPETSTATSVTPTPSEPGPMTAALAVEHASALSYTIATLRQLAPEEALTLTPAWVVKANRTLATLVDKLGQKALRQPIAQRFRGLYVIADPSLRPQGDILAGAEAALRGGACALQWRDKQRDKGDQLPDALKLAELCRQHNALFIINDHADLALACDADGLHVGQHDLPIVEARRTLHPRQLVGRSNALLKEALESQEQGADYIAVGAMFPTTTKDNTRPAGPETLRRVRQRVTMPIVAIGGITAENVAQVVRDGANAICVASAVIAAPDPEQAARLLLERMKEAVYNPSS